MGAADPAFHSPPGLAASAVAQPLLGVRRELRLEQTWARGKEGWEKGRGGCATPPEKPLTGSATFTVVVWLGNLFVCT